MRAASIRAQGGVLGRVIGNLLGNAVRYAPGPIEVSAQAVTESPSATVRISIRDRGPGIAEDQLQLVWFAFQRVEGSRSPLTGGYGLGLAIVRQLAQAQGWRVALRARMAASRPASMSRFARLRRPLAAKRRRSNPQSIVPRRGRAFQASWQRSRADFAYRSHVRIQLDFSTQCMETINSPTGNRRSTCRIKESVP